MKILLQQLQTPLSHKEKIFFGFFIAFPKYAWNSKVSEKKEEHASLIITEIIASERDVYLSVWKVLLQIRTPFGNQPVNGFQTLLKSTGHHYFSVF